MITAVGVVVPARDERETVGRSVSAVLAALARLGPEVEPAVCVVADRCTDDTAQRAFEAGAHVLCNSAEATIGEVRDIGMLYVRALLSRHRPNRTVLLSTDADTLVPPAWVTRHVGLVAAGAHAVAGQVRLADRHRLSSAVARLYVSVVDGARGPQGHGNVYAANLGVRADAYDAVGGFGAVACGEDHDLWRRLRATGHRCVYADGLRVTTSGRRQGRAAGGLAALLTLLDEVAGSGGAGE